MGSNPFLDKLAEQRVEAKRQRYLQAVEMRDAGKTHKEIGVALGISAPRVHQILEEGYGKQATRKARQRENIAKLKALLERGPNEELRSQWRSV